MNLRKYQLASLLVAFTAMVFLGGCASKGPEMKTVNYVDLERFMGDWYVIANIPTFLEKGAHNAVETYELNDDGTIATTFVFREDSFDGEEKRYTPKGFVKDTESNALWGMRFIWPLKSDYRIVYLDVYEYRLHPIGNSWIWEGLCAANVGVIEADSFDPDLFVEAESPGGSQHEDQGVHPGDAFLEPDPAGVENVTQQNDNESPDNHRQHQPSDNAPGPFADAFEIHSADFCRRLRNTCISFSTWRSPLRFATAIPRSKLMAASAVRPAATWAWPSSRQAAE